MSHISHRVATSDGTLEFITHDVNNTEVIFHPDHPWLNDIRSMSKMLEGEINIPHSSDINDFSCCRYCLEAQRLKSKYLAEKIRQVNELSDSLGYAHPFPQ